MPGWCRSSLWHGVPLNPLIYLCSVLSLLPLLVLPIHSSFLFLFSRMRFLLPLSLFSPFVSRLFLNDMLRSLTVLAGPAELTWRPTGPCPSLTFHTPAQDAHPSLLSRCTKELSVRLPNPSDPQALGAAKVKSPGHFSYPGRVVALVHWRLQ